MYFFLRMFILVLTRKCVWFLFNSGIAENGAVTETTDIGEKMRRRVILIFLAGILFLSGMDPVLAAGSFDFSHVIEEAEEISRRPYRDETLHLPEDLAHLTPAQYSDIRFRREQGIWYRQDFPFEMQFYHPGGLFNHSVTIYEISDGKVREIPYKFEEFDFGRNQIDTGRETADFGYAGFRLHYPLNREDYYDELISFLGASYFRTMAKGQNYGLSARGLAINTAESGPEEFPIFKKFWVERPAKDADSVRIYALLDSESVSGAYSFTVSPKADETLVRVNAVLFPRKDIAKPGIAPLTSMFLYGENTKSAFDDYRPEVHDSDGLLAVNGNGEKIWRPLDNSKHLRLSSFVDDGPKGFGLMQRDRNPRDYLDPEAMYEKRPSVWIEPLENWGKGKVQLAELPSVSETNDNVVAYWVPDEPMRAGGEYRFNYLMHWRDDDTVMPELAKVTATHSGKGGDGLEGEYLANRRKFVIDFSGFGTLDAAKEIAAGNIWADISNRAGTISNVRLMYTPSINGASLYFDIEPNTDITELRLLLRNKAENNKVISEVWSYQLRQ